MVNFYFGESWSRSSYWDSMLSKPTWPILAHIYNYKSKKARHYCPFKEHVKALVSLINELACESGVSGPTNIHFLANV
jgi:hypothetical protein